MKIQIDNFGPIHHFECDLDKDLHLILGGNNIGKSYAITVVYLLLKSFIEAGEEFDLVEDVRYMMGLEMGIKMGTLEDLPDRMYAEENGKEIGVEHIVVTRTHALLKEGILKRFQRHFEGTYGSIDTIGNRFSGEEPTIKLFFDGFEIYIGTEGDAFKLTQMEISTDMEQMHKEIGEGLEEIGEGMAGVLTKFGLNLGEREKFRIEFPLVARMLYHAILSQVLMRVHAIHYLPASRSGLYAALSAFGQIIAELSKSRSLVNGRIELPGIAVPVSDYYLDLSQIDPNEKREQDDPIQRIADDIERDILKGKVEFDKESRKLFYTPSEAEGLRLDIDVTSSMVSELAPIVSFLRHVVSKPARLPKGRQEAGVSPKPILFIEEPEAHLHPENQVRLMAAFAALAGAGVKVIITSHSSTLFHKLNNLILGKKIDTGVISATLFQQTDKGSEAVALPMDDLGIEDNNFIDTTEQLYDEKVDLIDRMNRDGDDDDAG
uniref:AAA ATPase domain-containing protein n=1 Tax=Candidatus Kentrum sp. MB TaxID=2138164 RepID=A0A450XLL7_9GAMM|nr:MAG: AAA ATPase domain-containing protein [Candidatus Kentron sp. MB]VFK34023.1 MAG: AAA ATPase domain-containing protein [Candidatus Kentron sp. MB]VFK76198.1 MAG: AAA ATPase domain-containing protein [Candidatus Kentron sp. MB]